MILSSRKKTLLILFFIALAVRLVIFGLAFSANHLDIATTIHGGDGYFEIATNLVSGHGFSVFLYPPYTVDPLRMPLYPIFMAFFLFVFGSYWAPFVAQLLIGCSIPILGFLFAEKFVGKLAFYVGLLLAFDPFAAYLSVNFYTETLFTALFLGATLLFMEYIKRGTYRTLVWFSVIFALTFLTRPTTQYLSFLVPVAFWFTFRKQWQLKKIIGHSAIFLLICLALTAPWLYRNYVEYGSVSTGSQPAFNAYAYLVPTVRSIANGTTFESEFNKIKNAGIDAFVITPATAPVYSKSAVEIIKHYPKALAYSVAITLTTFFTHDGMLTVLQYIGVPVSAHGQTLSSVIASPLVLVLIVRIFWTLVSILFAVGMWMYMKKHRPSVMTVTILFVVIYFALTTAINGLAVNARFRVPVEPFILTFACYGLVTMKTIIIGKRNEQKTLNHHPSV